MPGDERYIKTKLPPKPVKVAEETTRERWTTFQPYQIDRRGERNVPLRYLKNATWITDAEGCPGYQVHRPGRPSPWYNVEFNHIAKCWCEVIPSALRGDDHWTVVQPCRPEYECDILVSEVTTRGEEGPLDGQEPSEDSEEEREEPDNH